MAAEISFTIDWNLWIPVTLSVIALGLTVYQMRKKSSRDCIKDLEQKIDRAKETVDECEERLEQCGHEKDELRREKFALLEQIARLTQHLPAQDNPRDGGSDR